MNEDFNWFRNLRRYIFLNGAVCLTWLYGLMSLIYNRVPLPLYVDEERYLSYMISLLAFMIMLAMAFFFLAQAEALFRFLFEKLILKREIKPIPTHKNKFLQKLDDIYTWFYVITVLFIMLKIFTVFKPISSIIHYFQIGYFILV